MLTKITLDGAMGKKFGRHWELEISSPAEALRLIEANLPGLRAWLIDKKAIYSNYRITCVHEGGTTELLCDDTYGLERRMISIRFTPVVEGQGNGARIVVGALLMIASVVGAAYGMPAAMSKFLWQAGVTMVVTGVIGFLSPQPRRPEKEDPDNTASKYFNGPANTTEQGVPVQLVYGRVLVGSHAISAKMDIDDSGTAELLVEAKAKAEAKAAAAIAAIAARDAERQAYLNSL